MHFLLAFVAIQFPIAIASRRLDRSLGGDFFNNAKPCPFNRDCQCVDSDPPSPRRFETVDCISTVDVLPAFFHPRFGGKYNITGIFRIKSAKLARIPVDHFAAFESIDYLDLVNIGDENDQRWSQRVFDDNGLVTINNLATTNLNGILPPPAAIRRLGERGLRGLYVNGDRSMRLEANALRKFPKLEVLSIRNIDRIDEAIDPRAFVGLEKSLKMLTIVDTPIDRFPPIGNLSKLESLILNENGLTEITEGVFRKLKHLRRLSLDNNPIRDGVLDHLPRGLASLSLRKTDLTSPPRGIFKNARNLTKVDLAENKIQRIAEEDFRGAENLIEIDLSKNPISEIEHGAFANEGKSRAIKLEETNLSQLDLSICDGLAECVIQAGRNAILKRLVVGELAKIPIAISIDLSDTPLEYIDPRLESVIDQSLEFALDLSRNRLLQCDDLGWLAQRYACSPTQSIRVDDATCSDRNNQRLSDFLESLYQRRNCAGDDSNAKRKSA